MTHVMLDIETLGRKAGCPVLSVGAVVFNPYGVHNDEDLNGFEVKIDLFDSLMNGFEIDPETLKWWREQSVEAQESARIDAISIDDALTVISTWFDGLKSDIGIEPIRVWSQGNNFDFPILGEYFERKGQETPWQFWMVRDTRTVYDICELDPKSVERENVYHNALDDAIHQVKCIQKALQGGKI